MRRTAKALKLAIAVAATTTGCNFYSEAVPDTVLSFAIENDTDSPVLIAHLKNPEAPSYDGIELAVARPAPGVTLPRDYPRSNAEDDELWCHQFRAWVVEPITLGDAEAIGYSEVLNSDGQLYIPTKTLIEPGCSAVGGVRVKVGD